jgi:cytochrome c-type biogenesis protein CcmE
MITLTSTHKKRLTVVLLLIIGIGIAVALALTAFSKNMLYFFSPSQVVAGEAPKNKTIRLGGLVTKGSVQRAKDSLQINFDVTDYKQTIPIQYTGILPDLFREGQGIVAIGQMQANGTFIATEVLAKHDEKYMPPEVADSLKATGTHSASTPTKGKIE